MSTEDRTTHAYTLPLGNFRERGHLMRGIIYLEPRTILRGRGYWEPVAVMWCGYRLPLHDHESHLGAVILLDPMDPLVQCVTCKRIRAGLPVAVDALAESKHPERD